MARLTEITIKNLLTASDLKQYTPAERREKHLKNKVSEPVGSRGDGMLLCRKRESGIVEAYYRFKYQGEDQAEKLGQYKLTRDGYGFTLKELRDKAFRLAMMRRECGGDLKSYLAAERLKQEQTQAEAKRKAEAEASRGTFADLLEAYVGDMRKRQCESSDEAWRALEKDVIKSHPAIACRKARDITADDVVTVLVPVHKRAQRSASKLRSQLHAAFAFGAGVDHDYSREGDKRFDIQHNPVSVVPKQRGADRAGNRVLSHDEVRLLWKNIVRQEETLPVMALFVRFMLATAGQRPKQLLNARWDDYDFERRCVTVIDKKGKNSKPKIHVVPLSTTAIDILDEVRVLTGNYPWPFCTGRTKRIGQKKGQLAPISLQSLKNTFRNYNLKLIADAERNGKKVPEWFTARDVRRTVKNLMVDAGINREQRNLLQSHNLTGVDVKHYDRHDHLPEKRESMYRYDLLLQKIIAGEKLNLFDAGMVNRLCWSLK